MTGLPVERLRDYLRQLPSGARALLITELERAQLRGDEIPGGEFLLQEVRSAVREAGERTPRIGNPERLFFKPIEPFLVDDSPEHKSQGRIARATLGPIWDWICRDAAPQEAKTYCDEVSRALIANDTEVATSITRSFQDRVVECIRSALNEAQSDDKARRRLAGQIGTPKALDDVRDVLEILKSRDTLALIDGRLPGHIRNFNDSQVEGVKALLDTLIGRKDLLPYAVVMVMARLASPWQVIRLAIRSAESDDAIRIASTPYAVAVTLVLADAERMVGELKADLKRGASALVTSLLKSIHDIARGLRTELDLGGDSQWGRQLASLRAEVSGLLKTAIESTPGRVRRLLRPRPASEIVAGTGLDATDVADTAALIDLVGACRNYASELAISEMTLRTFHELQQYLDTGTQTLLEALRNATPADRGFRQSQVDAAVRFCSKVFGQEYASLLTKAAEVAANSERKAAAKG